MYDLWRLQPLMVSANTLNGSTEWKLQLRAADIQFSSDAAGRRVVLGGGAFGTVSNFSHKYLHVGTQMAVRPSLGDCYRVVCAAHGNLVRWQVYQGRHLHRDVAVKMLSLDGGLANAVQREVKIAGFISFTQCLCTLWVRL